MVDLIQLKPEEAKGQIRIRQGISRFGPFGTAELNDYLVASWFGSTPLIPPYIKIQGLSYVEDPQDLELPEDLIMRQVSMGEKSRVCGVMGTEFQIQIWSLIMEIPPGKTISYGELAKRAGNPRFSRAAGRACGSNWHAFLIPCHRVVYAGNQPPNYRWGPDVKRLLLGYEKNRLSIQNNLLWE
jgi:O-6-methylguanine DNA methyltransferase